MANLGPQTDDSTQSFVVRTWQEEPGHLRGTVRHVQSQDQRGFTRLNQAQEFMEQKLATAKNSQATQRQTAPATRSFNWSRRRMILAFSTILIVVMASVTVIVASELPNQSLYAGAVGQGGGIVLALLVGLGLGGLISFWWLRRRKQS